MKLSYHEISDNIYFLRIGETNVLYSPLKGVATLCPKDALNTLSADSSDIDLKKYPYLLARVEELVGFPNMPHSENTDIDYFDRLVVILSHRCNLSCTYCYAQESRSKDELEISVLKKAIEYIFKNKTGKTKVFTFIGGGEPLMTWDLLTKTIDFIIVKSQKEQINYQIRVVTNATLLTYDKIKWLSKKNNIIINVSSDILPDIQNSQRWLSDDVKSFDLVHNAIKLLYQFHIPYTIRSTITNRNVSRMSEMVEFAFRNYPDLKRLHFEPVTDNSLDNPNFFRSYLENFFQAFLLAEEFGVLVTNSYISSINHLKNQFCQGEMCIVPGNKIVACHRHSSKDDPLFQALEYGEINQSGVEISDTHIKKVRNRRLGILDSCQKCFAKWHCAGGCASKRMTYSIDDNNKHCDFIREIIARYILLKLNK